MAIVNKPRKRAYRLLMSGARYHAPNISRLTIGYRRGTLKALYDDYRDLCRQIQRTTKCPRIEYFATWVCDTTNEGLRRHAHIIWTSPLTRWTDVHPIFKEIVGDNCTCWLDELEEVSPYKIGYCLQYCTKQKGESVRYSKSAGWLPSGYDSEWEKIKHKHKGDDATTEDLVAELNTWIDKQRGIRRDTTMQSSLALQASDWIDASLQVVRKSAFVKRAL